VAYLPVPQPSPRPHIVSNDQGSRCQTWLKQLRDGEVLGFPAVKQHEIHGSVEVRQVVRASPPSTVMRSSSPVSVKFSFAAAIFAALSSVVTTRPLPLSRATAITRAGRIPGKDRPVRHGGAHPLGGLVLRLVAHQQDRFDDLAVGGVSEGLVDVGQLIAADEAIDRKPSRLMQLHQFWDENVRYRVALHDAA
jgi:hypothetical protein